MALICAYVGDDCIDPDCDVEDIEQYIGDPEVHFEIGIDGGKWIKVTMQEKK